MHQKSEEDKKKNVNKVKEGDEKVKPSKVVTPALPGLSEREESEEEEGGRGEKAKEMSAEKGKKSAQEKKRRIVHLSSVETLSESEEDDLSPSKKLKTHESVTIGDN